MCVFVCSQFDGREERVWWCGMCVCVRAFMEEDMWVWEMTVHMYTPMNGIFICTVFRVPINSSYDICTSRCAPSNTLHIRTHGSVYGSATLEVNCLYTNLYYIACIHCERRQASNKSLGYVPNDVICAYYMAFRW